MDREKVIVASKNPVKITAAEIGFSMMFPQVQHQFVGLSVPSGVADQPLSSLETLTGAKNRAQNARKLLKEAKYWVGIEGGIEKTLTGMEVFAWVYILSKEGSGKAKTASFDLPPSVIKLIEEGKELGEADDIVFGQSNSKQKQGAVGLLTYHIIDRARYYQDAVILALIPFRNKKLYF